ncbi:excitatory amino acid transporter 3 [Monomorium pharaonis]|uniref:excitatory amino acid transporter 3 n=1 Tax=Monomorium pharaonis TaxID=307658 RepID=UPI00063F17BE|nr:excitatory amino acid transporter 3 [Monomorium pharaonis]XP_012541715.1 excitatory amino acid transporter 3 [Monomorium pharaonis]XP_012541716.1 excitatory amino acid transporter 3 [Monomorium pharaonis]
MSKLTHLLLKHKLIITTLIGVTVGISCGLSLKHYSGRTWSQRDIMYIKFPGELFLRLVNCLILPLVTSSIISATCNLARSGPVGLMALYYYLTTTTIGIILCVVLVETIRPGELMRSEETSIPTTTKTFMAVDTILDLFRNLLPENLIHACMYQYQTVLKQPANTSVPIEEWLITSEYVAGTNVLGLVFYSLLIGVAIGKIGASGKPLSDFFNSLTDAIMKIMTWVILMAPIGVLFLIAGRMLEIDDFSDIINHLGFYILTVFVGLTLQGFVILPLLHWIVTRRSPYRIISKLGPAFATAIGTSSSTATVPYTIRCLEDLNINPKITKFIIPIGAAINMDGIALYETIGAIFIIQLRGVQFSLLKTIIISITCTVSCVGAAGIPSGGYMMLIMVLNSIGVPVEDVSLIIAVDWFVDRFRTTINIIGDSLGASIISQFYKKDLEEYLEEEICPLKTNVCDISKTHSNNKN